VCHNQIASILSGAITRNPKEKAEVVDFDAPIWGGEAIVVPNNTVMKQWLMSASDQSGRHHPS
jgi:hypothetical protein